MKKKAIIIFIGIILICSITLFLSAFFSGKDSDKLGEDTTRTTENGQAEDLEGIGNNRGGCRRPCIGETEGKKYRRFINRYQDGYGNGTTVREP